MFLHNLYKLMSLRTHLNQLIPLVHAMVISVFNILLHFLHYADTHCFGFSCYWRWFCVSDDLYVVQYQVDRKWYRARVRSILPSCEKTNEVLVDVVYIDYGNTEIISCTKWAQYIHCSFTIYFAEMWIECFVVYLTSWVGQAVYAATHGACLSREGIVCHTLTW
jgi:hypothetical protein